jgi:type I restriction enzyme R subunit
MSYMVESEVEEHAIRLFEKLGYSYLHGESIESGSLAQERRSFSDVVLQQQLRNALRSLNPNVPQAAIDDAARLVSRHDTPDLVTNNKRFHSFLMDGVPVEYMDAENSLRHDRLHVIDFDNPDNNRWLVVNQFTVKEGEQPRRPDLVIFVNGLPLSVIEFKNPTDEKATILGAFKQSQTYKSEIPSLLGYNEVLVVGDGTQCRVGSLTADWSRFSTWKRPDGKSDGMPQIDTLITGFFNKATFLDIVRYFTLFEVSGPKIEKKLAAYHQYYAVNKAIERTIEATSESGDQRIGVFWHTQGSGKSLSMVFYSSKIVQQSALSNPTIVVLTDRNDLDGQLYDQFALCEEFLRQKPEQAKDRDDLRDKLKVSSGGIVFTTIQKFIPSQGEDRYPLLSDRANIIVMADEAHRSQYGLQGKIDEESGDIRYGFARHVRDALPSASFVGFTGTPVERSDHNTRAVFGDYIDIYDVRRAVDDKATVRIFYEARIAKLQLDPAAKSLIDETFEDITEGQEDEEKQKHGSRWSKIEALVGTKHRISEIAKDLVKHFEERCSGFEFGGKGMVVCMSRRICVDLYNEIVKLRPAWHSTDDKGGALKVIMTGSAADGPDWQPHIRNKKRRKGIEQRFKNADDPLKMVIVRDMWLTGFNVEPLHTMYVDKPMRGHTLMQAIARVNRVFRDKPGGLVADYIGIANDLKAALTTYIDSGGTGDPVLDEEEAIALFQREYEIVRDMYHGFGYQAYLESDSGKKLEGLTRGADHILGLPDGKTRYLKATKRLSEAYALASTSDLAHSLSDEVAYFKGVRATIVKISPSNGQSLEDVELALQQLVSEAVSSQGVVDVLAAAGVNKPDISVFSDEFLAEVQGLEHKNLARQMLEKLLRDEIKVRSRTNAVQSRKFSEMLDSAVRKYDNRSIDTVQFIEHLIEFAKELRDDPKRAEQLGLNEDEVAFYDALADNESALSVLGDKQLRIIARELVQSVRASVTIDWNLKESAKAIIRLKIRKILQKHGYPPDKTENATRQVLAQAELLCKEAA